MPSNKIVKPKLYFESLSLEITRRCNMTCEHCMRGDPENKDLDPTAFDFLLNQTAYIGSLTLTGGEPSIHPDGIQTVADLIKKSQTDVSGIYVVTNGLVVSDEFMQAYANVCLATKMYADYSGLALSQDMFHDSIPEENIRRLRLFSTFDEDNKKTDWTRFKPKAFGRAKDLRFVETTDEHLFTENPFAYSEIRNGIVYITDITPALTVDGYLLTQSDYAYEDVDKIKICNVFDPNWFDILMERIQQDTSQNK